RSVYAVLPKMRPFLNEVIEELGLEGITAAQLDNLITIDTSSTTQLMTIRVQHPERAMATLLADTVAQKIVEKSAGGSQSGDAYEQIQAQIKRVEESVERSEQTLLAHQVQRLDWSSDSERAALDVQLNKLLSFLSDTERLQIDLSSNA